MSNFKAKSEQGYTLIQVLIFIVFISILVMVGSFIWNLFHHQNSLDEQALKKVEAVIIETHKKAKNEKKPYSVIFQNNAGIPQYSIYPQENKPSSWKTITNYSIFFSSHLKINFNSQGNLEKPGEKVVLKFHNQKKCLLVKEPFEKMENRQDAECN